MDEQVQRRLQELWPAYAIGALDDDELAFVEAQLGDAPDYTGELAAFREAATLLALSTPPVLPPPAVKVALMARLDALDAPVTTHAQPQTADLPAPPPAIVRPTRWRVHPAWLAVAAVLLVALVGWNVLLHMQLGTKQRQNATLATQATEAARYEKLLSDPQAAHVVSGPGPGRYNLPPTGYIYVDQWSSVAFMLTYWLPPLNAGQQYQLWLITPEGTRDNGGVFNDDGHGNAHVVINAPANFAKYQSVGVTIEPTGGSAWPTGPRVMGGDIR